MAHAARRQIVRHALHGVALADAAEIQLHRAGRVKCTVLARSAVAASVSADGVHADAGAGGVDVGERWQASLPHEEAPAAAERRRGDVERAAGVGVKLAAAREEREQLGVDLDGRIGRVAVDAGQVAGVAEDGERGFEAVGFAERVAGGGHMTRVLPRQRDLEPAGHRRPIHPDPMPAIVFPQRREARRRESAAGVASGRTERHSVSRSRASAGRATKPVTGAGRRRDRLGRRSHGPGLSSRRVSGYPRRTMGVKSPHIIYDVGEP